MNTKVPHLLRIAVLGTALLIVAVGCSSSDPVTGPQPIDSRTGLAGVWEGIVGLTPLRMEIEEAADRSLIGAVTLGSGEKAERFTIVGTVWTAPTTFTLFLDSDDDRFRTLRGTVLQDRIAGDYSETDETNRTRTESWEANRLKTIAPL